ncbi:MAG: excinuclease ABC subunit UvrC, partial [Clostridia bacterium]|nr:excinuclease ABC subunit UvrC [Clostridia bacterium]
LALENNLIKKYQPYYYILLKDGKAYAYIRINLKKDYPHFEITRKVNTKDRYFGPYFAGLSAQDILGIINYAYPIRKCSQEIKENGKIKKPCLYHEMHLCSAPCANKISKADYREMVEKAMKFLKGDTAEVEQILKQKMMVASNAENFETALELRNKLKMLDRLKNRIATQIAKDVDYDVFALCENGEFSAMCVIIIRAGKVQGIQSFDIINCSQEGQAYSQFITQYYSSHPYNVDEIILDKAYEEMEAVKTFIENKYGHKVVISTPLIDSEKMKLLKMAQDNARLHLEKNLEAEIKQQNESIGAVKQLQKELNLNRLPLRIECYDISNTFGTYTVASMSVLINGEKAKNHYRKFKIENVDFIDDFASMREVLTRRMNELSGEDVSFSVMPDLIVIDGGKGQLSSAVEVLNSLGYKNDLISLAKRMEEVFVPNKSVSIMLKKGSYSLRLLQLARDEAHRFAITFNRSLRAKGMFKGGLESIKGVGKVVRRILLSNFKTIENIKNASLETLENTKGISKATAKNIYEHFKK